MRHAASADDVARQRRTEQIAELAAHPGMPDAIRTVCSGIVELFGGSQVLNVVVSDRARLVMGFMAIYLDAGYDPMTPLSGLTVNRFKAQCAATGLCSPGRAAAMLGLMRFAGYLKPASDAQRGQPLRLVPTEKLIGPASERWRRAFSGLTHLRPEGKIGLALLDDPAFARTFACAAVELFLTRERLVEHGRAIVLFTDRKGGLVVLMTLMLSAEPGDDMPPRGPISFPAAALARRFGISRAQVKDVLQSAVSTGLLLPAGPDSTAFVIAPRLRESILGFFGAVFLLISDTIAAAEPHLRDVNQRAADGPGKTRATAGWH